MSGNGIAFIDAEIDPKRGKVLDIGAVTGDGREFHSCSKAGLRSFLEGIVYVCGHNIMAHDLRYLGEAVPDRKNRHFIDTLYFSPLLFPKKPYHRLVKDDKLATDELSNPLSDAKKARDLFYDEEAAYFDLDAGLREIYGGLLRDRPEFAAFFRRIGTDGENGLASDPSGAAGNIAGSIVGNIVDAFDGSVCKNAPIRKMAERYPIELAYALAQIGVIKYDSMTPPWVLKHYPRVAGVVHLLRGRKCGSCAYCADALDEDKALKRFFRFDEFRSYDGNPLQKLAVEAAVAEKSILAVFPTGGGKSLTFQLPALMAAANERGLTVVISPLQALMKDQTDNLENQYNITEAVTINGSLDPVERANAYERVESGSAGILYISPESLRSKSIEGLLLKRNVVRFVIDEAHCFSAWGHDFRVDYLYIADFIKGIQEKRGMPAPIPVSCFTATAKNNVISDIKAYFKSKLSLELEVFRANAARANLSYHVFPQDDEDEKDRLLRQLLSDTEYPAIVYVSRTGRAEKLASKLTSDGYPAIAYHGRMDRKRRIDAQNAFMRGDVNTIVATSAFGMGVDKKNVGLVVHYDISASLEDYLQEAGRAGRDESIEADCCVLFSDEDLNKNFIRLNQTKLTQKEIQQIWKAIKGITRLRATVSQSALEIARAAGWDDSIRDMETRVKTAISALEQSGFVSRGLNMPRIFADSILVRSMEEAKARIDKSSRFDDDSRTRAIRIIGSLISAKSKARGAGEQGEDRVDYIADRLGIERDEVIRVIGLLREERILADAKDLTAYIRRGDRISRSSGILSEYMAVEEFLHEYLSDEERTYNIKEMNEELQARSAGSSMKQLDTIINYYDIKRLIRRNREQNKNYVTIVPEYPMAVIAGKCKKRHRISETIIEHLFASAMADSAAVTAGSTAVVPTAGSGDVLTEFSVLELKEAFAGSLYGESAETDEIEDALYYLLKIGALRIEGGFLVIYNAMRIERLKMDGKSQYKKTDYAQLEEYYANKRLQIHIVGEYANRLMDDYREAMVFVDDYFTMEYEGFLGKYFKGRREEIRRNITPGKFKELFGELSPAQLRIINDRDSRCIVVAAGPGSGKTKLLTHKLASLYTMEDIKHEQMLMLTFSRASATEFKKRLMKLIGNAAHFIQITTFHSYCFDLLGKVGDLDKSEVIVRQAIDRIIAGEVDVSRITKSVLVIDEAQDMSEAEYALVRTLIEHNVGLRLIAVGDDDQNIYEFRGSSSEYFKALLDEPGAKKYELVDNYRSSAAIVGFANDFSLGIAGRLKTKPIIAVSKESGTLAITKLSGRNMTIPVVNALLEQKPPGSTCIIARTNDEVLSIIGLLLQKGIAARQIQTNTEFSLYNLAELRSFVCDIEGSDDGYAISDVAWKAAVRKLKKTYASSSDLQGSLKLLSDFAAINSKIKYKSDLKQFIRESKLEDFIPRASDSAADAASADGGEQMETVFVSTIHQTKGREFDNVFLAQGSIAPRDDASRRAVYVAITRAKKNLQVFYNGDAFDAFASASRPIARDDASYPDPPFISRQLSHKDVALGFFNYRRREASDAHSGQKLAVKDAGCCMGGTLVLKFSASFRTEMERLKSKGYLPSGAEVRHVVHWQGKDMDEEIKIILPNVEFQKSGETPRDEG